MVELAQIIIFCIAIAIGLVGGLLRRKKGAASATTTVALCFLFALIGGLYCMPILIIVVTTLGVVILCYQKTRNADITIAAGLATIAIVALILIFSWQSAPTSLDTERVLIQKIELCEINSELGTTGKFLWGTGNIEPAIYYKYGYRQGTELIEELIKKTPDVHIIDNRTDGRGTLEVYRFNSITEKYPSLFNDVVFNGNLDRKVTKMWDETRLHVPVNSVTSGFAGPAPPVKT